MADQSRPVTGYPAGYPNPQTCPEPNPNPNPNPSLNPNSNSNGHTPAYPSYASTGTAYAYAAPPPQVTYYNPNPYYADPYAAQRATFCRRIFAVLIATAIITGTVIFVFWLVLRPRIPEFRVDSLTLSNFNLSSSASLITGNWDVRFTVRNPNSKITLAYNHIEGHVYYKSEQLAMTTAPPFVQGTKNETSVRATFAVLSAYVDEKVVDGINSDRARGSVGFNVKMLARVRFKAGAWRARRRLLTVLCGDLSVGVSSNSAGGSLVGGSRECRVGL